MEHSPEIDKIAAALAAAQAVMGHAAKSAQNPHLRSRYADLAEVIDATRPHLAAQGIAIVQAPSVAEGRITVRTSLLHASGQWVACELAARAPDNKGLSEVQSIGSVITYLRRYTLQSLCGIAADDDDGNAAPRSEPRPQSAPSSRGPAEPPKVATQAPPAAGGGLSPRGRIPALIEGISIDQLSDWLASDHARAERARARFGLPRAAISAYTDAQIADLANALTDHGSAVVDAVVEWMERP